VVLDRQRNTNLNRVLERVGLVEVIVASVATDHSFMKFMIIKPDLQLRSQAECRPKTFGNADACCELQVGMMAYSQ
jgi:hypothetical protein